MFARKICLSKGFTLIEVLISIVILGGGVLGILNLQARALMDNQDAYLRTQAVLLAYDMSDRIRANKIKWGSADDAEIADILKEAGKDTTADHFFCSVYDPTTEELKADLDIADSCSADNMAVYDVYRWQQDVAEVLNGGTVSIAWVSDVNTSAVTKDVLRLTITWSRVNQEAQNKLQNASYTLDVRP